MCVLLRHGSTMILVSDTDGNPLSIDIILGHVVTMDLGVKISVRRRTMQGPIWGTLAHGNHLMGRPSHRGALRRGGRLVIAGVRRAIVDVVRVHSMLVLSPLMLDHGGF